MVYIDIAVDGRERGSNKIIIDKGSEEE